MNAQLLVAITALLSIVMAVAIIGVIQLGCLISQLADLKAFVMTVISLLTVPPAGLSSQTKQELRAKLKGTP